MSDEYLRSHLSSRGLTHIGDRSTCISEDCCVPGVDRPWQYGDVYYFGGEANPNRVAVRVTDPQLMNLLAFPKGPHADA